MTEAMPFAANANNAPPDFATDLSSPAPAELCETENGWTAPRPEEGENLHGTHAERNALEREHTSAEPAKNDADEGKTRRKVARRVVGYTYLDVLKHVDSFLKDYEKELKDYGKEFGQLFSLTNTEQDMCEKFDAWAMRHEGVPLSRAIKSRFRTSFIDLRCEVESYMVGSKELVSSPWFNDIASSDSDFSKQAFEVSLNLRLRIDGGTDLKKALLVALDTVGVDLVAQNEHELKSLAEKEPLDLLAQADLLGELKPAVEATAFTVRVSKAAAKIPSHATHDKYGVGVIVQTGEDSQYGVMYTENYKPVTIPTLAAAEKQGWKMHVEA